MSSRTSRTILPALLVAVVTLAVLVSGLPRFRWTATVVAVAGTATMGWLLHRRSRTAAGERIDAAEVRHTLEEQVQAGTAQTEDSNAQLRSIIDSAVDAIIVIDEKGLVESFNPAAERLFGYPAAEVIGRNVNVLMPSPYREEHDGYLDRYMTTGEARIIGAGREVTGLRRDGTTFPLHLSVGEMSVAGQRKFTGLLHDLSARVALEQQLRASEAQWRSIIHSAVDGIILIDGMGHIEAFNPAAERLFGWTEAEVLGKNVSVLMPSPYQEEHDDYLARYKATGIRKIIGTGRDVTGLRRDGTTFPLHLSVGEVIVEGEPKFTGIVHDLSGRVRIEQQLREHVALARLGEMAAVIAHEVKNPLAGIRGAVQVIGSRLPAGNRDAAVLSEIVARIDALNDLMKDLLLFARPPQPRPTFVKVGPLVGMTAQLIAQDASLQNAHVEVTGSSPPVWADAEMLKIVFHNLLMNGFQAMQGRGVIRVVVDSVGTTCRVAITDTGPGIPPEQREKLFAAFFTTKSRGSGLGLATAKRLVEAQRGTIAIDCPPEGGTTVMVELPTAPA